MNRPDYLVALIARHLFLTEATAKGQGSRILDKLGCENRAQAGLISRDCSVDTRHDTATTAVGVSANFRQTAPQR